MIVKTFSYRYAEEILQHPKYVEAYNELIEICRNCPLPVFKGKSERQTSKDVVQQLMNTYFLEVMKIKGWKPEPYVSPDTTGDALRADFRKTFIRGMEDDKLTIQVEVEFGNIASSYRNYFKFQLSYSYGLTDICVIVVPSWHLSNRIDSGVASFEKVLREIPSAMLSITVPILVVGLFDLDDDGKEVDSWDVKADCESLQIIQNKNKKFSEEHRNLVLGYLSRI